MTGAGIVYFLALFAYSTQWATALRLPTDGPADTERAELFGRFGLLLTGGAAAIHFVALFSRGMAASPNRVPWGNMYEFTLSGTFVVVLGFLVLYRRYSLAWLGPWVVGFVFVVLMADVVLLHEKVAPLTEALSSPWLVIHVVAAILATGLFEGHPAYLGLCGGWATAEHRQQLRGCDAVITFGASLNPNTMGGEGGYLFGGLRAPFRPVWNRSRFEAVKRAVSIPVLAVGGIRTRAEIDGILDGGHADLVGVGRPFYAEPDVAARLLDGDGELLCRNSNLCVPAQMLGMKGACYNPEVVKLRARR